MNNKKPWALANMPDQRGRAAIVTGANSGVGYQTARALAHGGATVIMACRDLDRCTAAAASILVENPAGNVETMALDLADLEAVHVFASTFLDHYERLDLLVNNAAVMRPPLGHTSQGFEQQFGINHLGHFALTGLLIARLEATPQARVVTVSSRQHRRGRIDFDNLNAERGYDGRVAYAQSKLANLLFTLELARRLAATGSDTLSVAAAPGWTDSNLHRYTPFTRFLNRFFAHSPAQGALPILRAATAPDVQGGDYFAPGKRFRTTGPPVRTIPAERAQDPELAARLWEVSATLTGVHYLEE